MAHVERPTVAVTGLSGYVGTRLGELVGETLALVDWYRTSPSNAALASYQLDLCDEAAVALALQLDRPRAVINIAAQANVDVCEQERDDREGSAWRINATAPGVLARACATAGTRFVHVSTDYVFDGQDGPYHEQSPTDGAANWYGNTKLAGERAVTAAGGDFASARIMMPYRRPPASRLDLPQLIRNRLSQGQTFSAATDQLVAPTFLDDIIDALVTLLFVPGQGIYHLAGATLLSPFEAALIVARTFQLDESLVEASTLDAITGQGNRAPRPARSALLSQRFRTEYGTQLARPLRGFAEGVGMLRHDVEPRKGTIS